VSVLEDKISEADVLRFVENLLRTKGYIFWRENTIGVYDARKGIYRTNPHRRKGVADVTVIVPPNGTYVGIECKSSSGDMSQDQKYFRDDVMKTGAAYYLIRSQDEALKMLEWWPFKEKAT